MKLIETYANNCSVDIKNKPEMLELFFPVPVEKYITLQIKSGMPAKDYDYFQVVIDILVPILEKENIKILLLGDKESPSLEGVINLCGQTSIHQAYYLLSRSLLHFGIDSWMAHASGTKGIPLITIFGSTTPKNHGAHFHDKDKTIFIESDRNGHKPSFSAQETIKTINKIKPEQIAAAVCKLLNLDFDFPFESIYWGQFFNHPRMVEMCGQAINVSNMGLGSIIVRMDFAFDEQSLVNQLMIVPCSLVTDKPINLDILKQYKGRIQQLIYIIDEDNNPKFASACQKLGLNLLLISSLSEEKIKKYLLDYLDIGFIHRKDLPKSIVDTSFSSISINKLYYKSNKVTLAKQKIYTSQAGMLEDISVPNINQNFQPIINRPEWFSELDYFAIFKLKD